MKMTDYGGADSFFDVEPHDSPVLKGEYATVASPVREKTLINSPIPSANMSKTKGSRNYSSDSRSGSRSPRSRSRSPENNNYSDSFDSEDSAQDSRPSSRRSKSKKVSMRSKATVNKRTSSSYSRDSRYSTSSNVTSSGYGKTRKTYSTGGNKGRASSIAGNVTPRNVTEVTKRMLSAKGHTISRLRSENEEVKIKYEESVREIKLLKQLQKKQERALDKFEGTESELPELLRKHSAELDSLHQRVRKYKDKDRNKDRQLQEQHQELCKLQSEMRKMKKVAGDKHLLERDSLQHKLEKQSEQLDEKEKRVADLERYIENIRKNQNHQLNDVKTREQELKGQNMSLEMENERLQVQLREKDKELDIRNIYSHRVIKPPVKLRSTSPRKIMLDKSTTTDNLIPSPHPPEAPKRTSSAEIRQQISEKKNNIIEKEKKPIVEKQKKELNEHELILQQLDLGIQLKENKDEEDDVMKSLAMAKKRREEQRRKEEEQRRKEEQEKAEEMRLKMEEEERLRLKKSREEEANREKQRQEKDTPNSIPAKSSIRTPSDDEEEVPYFGSKPKANQATYAVNSVRGLQEYRTGSAEKGGRGFGGSKVFGEDTPKNSSYNQSALPTNGNYTSNNIERKAEESERLNREQEDTRKKKEELLAKMREIDQKNEKPDSGRSRKNYKFTDPVENLHNGRPSHGLGTTASKDDDELAFGSYAPTFSKGGGSKKHQEKPFANGFTNEKKSDLLSNLFSKGDSEKSNASSDNDETFSSGTKAKPIKDKSAFPWDSGVDSGKETGAAKTGRRAGGMDNSLFGADNKAPYMGKLAVNEVDDFDDDLEEVIL